MIPPSDLLKRIKSDIQSRTVKTEEYSDFLLMKIWHCTPSEFENQTEYMINLHKRIIDMENRHEEKEMKRNEQKNKLRSNL